MQTYNTSGAYHVQHAVWYEGTAINFGRVEIAFISALFHWSKLLTAEGGRKPERLEKTPDELQTMSPAKDRKLKPLPRLELTPWH